MTDTRLDKLFYELQGIKADTIRIIDMLSDRSKEIAKVELKKEAPEITSTVSESIKGRILGVTAKAVKIEVGEKFAWIPKSAVKNLDKIVVVEGDPAELEIHNWFKEKLEWQ